MTEPKRCPTCGQHIGPFVTLPAGLDAPPLPRPPLLAHKGPDGEWVFNRPPSDGELVYLDRQGLPYSRPTGDAVQ